MYKYIRTAYIVLLEKICMYSVLVVAIITSIDLTSTIPQISLSVSKDLQKNGVVDQTQLLLVENVLLHDRCHLKCQDPLDHEDPW